MRSSIPATVIATLALAIIASPAAAVITIASSIAGAPDPAIPNGFTTVVSFDAPSALGIVNTISGTANAVITGAQNVGGVRAAPAGTAQGGIYQSIGTGGVSTFDFTNYLQPNRFLTGFSLYWGSVDAGNIIDFVSASGAVISTFTGNQLPKFDGNQTGSDTNRRLTFAMSGLDQITKIRLRSTNNAFEYDTFAVTMGPIPEPASWAMLITGFGLIGAAMRRRRTLAVQA